MLFRHYCLRLDGWWTCLRCGDKVRRAEEFYHPRDRSFWCWPRPYRRWARDFITGEYQ